MPALLVHLRLRRALTWAALSLIAAWTVQATAQTRPGQPASSAATPLDDKLGQAVLVELDRDRHLVAGALEVAANDGIVVLSGTVAVSLWKQRASWVAGSVRGVRAVVNRIRTVPVRLPDALVASNVRAALRETAALRRTPIGVRVNDGVVELTGAIGTWEQQQLAERIAASLAGVRFCLNQLTSSRAIKRTSGAIAADVRTRLDRDPLVQHDPIRVSVRQGRVLLAGLAGSMIERKRAISLAWVKGVRAVDASELVVDTANRPNANVRLRVPTDSEIAKTIQALVAYWPWANLSSMSTSVVAGVVTLSGTVPTLVERDAAKEMVRSAIGVVEVKDELRGPWWHPPPSPTPQRPRRRKR